MAAKKTGGLGRNFDFILEDNMPIAVQSPIKSKIRPQKSNSPITDNIVEENTQYLESSLRSDERIQKKATTLAKDTKKARVVKATKSNIKQHEQKHIIQEDGLRTNNRKTQEQTLISKSNIASLKQRNKSRGEAIANLQLRIYSTLRGDKVDEIVITDDGDEETIKDFYSPFVKIKLEKTKKEGNNYVKAEKRTWS